MIWCTFNVIIDIAHEGNSSSKKKCKSFLQIEKSWWIVCYNIQSPFKMIVSQISEKTHNYQLYNVESMFLEVDQMTVVIILALEFGLS